MKKSFYLTSFILLFFLSRAAAQVMYGMSIIDIKTFSFEPGDSLHNGFGVIDTTGMQLWQIGTTVKPFFSTPDTPSSAIMTGTTSAYPLNANNGFLLKLNANFLNPIISFKHKYQTSAGLDGGIVEFSNDNGASWENMMGACNYDSMIFHPGIHTENFYHKTDTLFNGARGFSGSSAGWQTSRFQFFQGVPLKGTAGCGFNPQMYIRFRFVSDAVAESMDGWLIDSIQVRADNFGGAVKKVSNYASLNVYPNPSNDGSFHFPQLSDEFNYRMEIRNSVGKLMGEMPYQHLVHLNQYPAGLYFYNISNGDQSYRGKLVITQ